MNLLENAQAALSELSHRLGGGVPPPTSSLKPRDRVAEAELGQADDVASAANASDAASVECSESTFKPATRTFTRRVAVPEVATIIAENSSIGEEGSVVDYDRPNQRFFVVAKGQVPVDLMPGLERKFNEEEIKLIWAKVGKTIAPQQAKPVALWVFGPSAVGKSTVTRICAMELFGSAENAVEVDGALFREVHSGWGAVVNDGTVRAVLHDDAWDIFKKKAGSTKLKKRLIEESIRDRQGIGDFVHRARGIIVVGRLACGIRNGVG